MKVRFALFKNKYKEKDSQPDYKGVGTFFETKEHENSENGVEVQVAGWKKTSKKGVDYISGVVDLKKSDEEIPL